MMNELVDAQNFNFLDIHTYIYIHIIALFTLGFQNSLCS